MSEDRSPKEGEQTPGDDVHGTRWEQLLGTGAKPAMLLTFVANHNRDLNKTEIADAADVSEMTVHRNIDDLLELGVVENTRKAGNAPMYQLTDSDLAGLLVTLDRQLITDGADDIDDDS